MPRTETRTGGRPATTGVIAGQGVLSVGNPASPTVDGFKWVQLTDVARLESGHTPSRSKPEYWNGDVPWIGIRDATGNHGRVIFKTKQWITVEGLANSSARLLPAGTVCLSRTASVGYVVTMGIPMATSQDFVNWVCGPEISSTYLRYLLLAEQETVRRFAHGSTHQTVYFPEAKAFHVCLPERQQQDAIAEVLGALDDKIAVNDRIASTTSDLARAIMDQLWTEGCVTSLVRGDAAVPHGWQRTTLGSLCATGGGAIQTGPFGSQLHASDYVDSGIPSVMPQNIGDNRIGEEGIARITAADAERLSKYLLKEGDIVYSRRGDVKRRALVRKYEAGWLCGTGCLRVRVGTATEPLFMSYYLGEPEIQEWIAQHAVGATMPNLNTAILGEVPVVLPPCHEVHRVNERLSGLDAMAAHLQHENHTLAELRDTLLPQLLSGKLHVKDAVRTVEEAV
ncbi:restriction endonuclease subunit S [Kitasatospora sp. NPDC096077]|uniref:restriction endonuclease subunit S n=1 Tax=Kitasatospora sp. NPDC096077 TaxID=3155544 RepID=UPI003331D300